MVACTVCAHFSRHEANVWEQPAAVLVGSATSVSRRESDDEPQDDDDDACALGESTGIASYARYSSEMQDARSIIDQQRKCGERATSLGLRMDPRLQFSDEAVSGAKHDRQGFEAFMMAAWEGLIRVIFFENLSRMARDVGLTIMSMKELVYRHRVQIISIDDAIDTANNPQWELIAVIIGVQNEQYLKALAKFVHRGQEGVVLSGLCVGDYCFGFGSVEIPDSSQGRAGKNKKNKKKYVVIPEHAAWVASIFEWFVAERRSLRWITRELNKERAPKDHRSSTPL